MTNANKYPKIHYFAMVEKRKIDPESISGTGSHTESSSVLPISGANHNIKFQ